MKVIIYHVKRMNLQIACADNVSQIENLKAINRHIQHRYFAWFMPAMFSCIYLLILFS